MDWTTGRGTGEMGRRDTLTFAPRGLWLSGSAARTPEGKVRTLDEITLRPGPRWSLRSGFDHDQNFTPAFWPRRFLEFTSPDDALSLLAIDGQYRDDVGAWASLGLPPDVLELDSSNFLGKMFGLYAGTAADAPGAFSFDGTDVDLDPFMSGVTGATIETYLERLFIGAPREIRTSLLSGVAGYAFEDTDYWEAFDDAGDSVPTVAVAGDVRVVTVNGRKNGFRTTEKIHTTGAEPEYVVVEWDLQAKSANLVVPFTLLLTDENGEEFSSIPYELPERSKEPDWLRFGLQGLIPANTDVYVEIKMYTATRGPALGVTLKFNIADASADDPKGAMATRGRMYYSAPPQHVVEVPNNGILTSERLIWCEVDDPTYFGPLNYIDHPSPAGPITVVRAGRSNKLAVYKERGIWLYQGVGSVNLPITREGIKQEFGCGSVKAHDRFEGDHFFIDAAGGEVFAWTLEGDPTPLASLAMREALFGPKASRVASPVLAVDRGRKEVWVYAREHKLDLYSLELKEWIGSYTVKDDEGDPMAVSDLRFVHLAGETVPRMWAAVHTADYDEIPDEMRLVRLDEAATLDNVMGNTREVRCTIVLPPLRTPAPALDTTLETLGIDHGITGDQVAGRLIVSASSDNGQTWTEVSDTAIEELLVDGEERHEVDVWETGRAILVKIEYEGQAGEEFFTIYGGDMQVNVSGVAEFPEGKAVSA